MSRFASGEVAIFTGLIRQVEFNGRECVIDDGPHRGHYAITVAGHPHWCMVHQKNLRKKKFTKDDAMREAIFVISRAKQLTKEPA